MALINHFKIIQLFGNPGNLDVKILQSQIHHSLYLFHHIWSMGFVLFGLHLIFTGSLIRKADYVPSILGILLIISGLIYFTEFFIKLLMPEYNLNLSMISGVAEVVFMVWLFIKWKHIRIN